MYNQNMKNNHMKKAVCTMIPTIKEYKEGLTKKRNELQRLFHGANVAPFLSMEDPYHYRCKVIASFAKEKGKIIAGIYQENTHKVIAEKDTYMQDKQANAILKTIVQYANAYKIEPYNEDTGYGLLRHVLIRVGKYSDEILVCFILANSTFPSRKNFAQSIMQQHPNIKTITYSINAKQTSIVLGNNDKTIIGPGFIYDYLGDLKFRISSRSFYQVNPKQTERLYKVALEKADIKSSDKVLDTYCGIGTITLFASKLAKHVIGVESNPAAIGDAMFNQKINQITNVEFIKKDATVFMNQMAMKKELFDVLIMDPPRRGSTKSFIQAVGKLQPKKVLYISCNPTTLKQDLKEFIKVGYEYTEVIPVDMFPFTDHVECVVLMSRVEK